MCVGKLAVRYIRTSTAKYDAKRIARQTPPESVSVQEFAYLDDGDPMHMLNVYRPEGEEGVLPLIVNVHGGAWVYGDKDLNKYYCMYLASKGFCVVGMSYRLAPAVTLKEQVSDVVASMHAVCERAEELGADTSRVMLSGDSAGGHLASLVLCTMLSPELARVYEVKPPEMDVRCLVMSHPVCEVHSVLRDKNCLPDKRHKVVQRVFDKILFGEHPHDAPVYEHSAFTEYAKGVTLPAVMLIGCERDVYARHSVYLSGLLAEMKKQGKCSDFLFDYVRTEEESRKLRHVYNIVHYEWEESKRVNDLSLSVFRDSCKQ